MIIIIHSLKPAPKQVMVTNLFLWQQVIREKKTGLRVQKLIKNLPLLLQIIAVIMASISLADAILFHASTIKGNIILVLDTTASMQTQTSRKTRFELAKEKAISIVDEMHKESEMLIIEAGKKPRLISGFTDNKDSLKEMITNISQKDTTGDIYDGLKLAMSFLDTGRDDWIIPITDGAGHDPAYFTEIHHRIRPVFITGGDRNLGITKFEFRRDLNNEDSCEIMLEVRSFITNSVMCPIELKIDDKTFIRQTFGFKPLEKKLLIFSYSGLIAGRAQAELLLEDDLAVDNKAFSILNTAEDIWVMLVTKSNYFLEKILEAYPNFMVNSFDQIISSSWENQIRMHDIIILDRVDPPDAGHGNFLLIRSLLPSIPLKNTGEVNNPKIIDWDSKTPLLAGLKLTGLNIENASMVESQDMLPIIKSADTGLMYSYEKNGLRAVYVGFEFEKSNLPLRIAFPVMMSNIFQWLHPDKLRFSTAQIKAGDPFEIQLKTGSENFSILPPSGKWTEYSASANSHIYDGTYKTGIYTVAEGDRKRRFAVNLTDEFESNILTNIDEASTGRTSIEDTDPVTIKQPLWLFFLLCALVIMIAEWHLWLKDS